MTVYGETGRYRLYIKMMKHVWGTVLKQDNIKMKTLFDDIVRRPERTKNWTSEIQLFRHVWFLKCMEK